MPNIDQHSPGSFSWIELGTTDQDAAKTFYSSLFGWSVDDSPMGPNEIYTTFKVDGRSAAAAYHLRPGQLAQRVPPHWMLYVTTQSADDSASKASQLGGQVLAPAFDVFDLGRMAVLQDPTGAVFCVWQGKKHHGVEIEGVPGTLCWADLRTRDVERAKDFYTGLFGWEITAGEQDQSGYLHIKNGAQYIGGVPPAQHLDPNTPPHWLAYFYVADCDVSANKAKSLGAKAYVEPTSFENVGRLSVLADPQGAVFAIFKDTPHS